MFHFKRKRNLIEEEKLERSKQELEKEQIYQKLLHEIKESVSTEKEFAEKIYLKQKKQDVILEELLELAVEHEDEQEKAHEMFNKQETEFMTKEEMFVKTILKYDEYLYQMEKQSKKANDSWYAQLQLVRSDMKRQLSLCEISEITWEQETADPSLCHILEVIPTSEPDMDNKISEVISPGYIYRGKIKQKTKVTIFKFKED